MDFSEKALQTVREDRLLIDRVDRWLYEEIEPYLGSRVLEIGCGMGNFARYLTDRELYVGTDIDATSVNHMRESYRDRPNMKAFVADAADEEQVEQVVALEVDTVFSLNVFEHVEDDVRALANAWRILQPGGQMILVVPAHDWLYGSIDRAIGHYRRYDKRTLAERFERVGFRVLAQKYINGLGALGWWVSARLFKNETPPSGQLKLFNRVVPLLRRVERVVEMPFGISVMTVGGKETADGIGYVRNKRNEG